MTLVLNTLISNIRAELNDTTTSHLVRGEIPLGLINSSNTLYTLNYYPVTNTANAIVTVDGAVVLPANYAINSNMGKLTMASAPASSILVDYYFQAFTDADITVWINHAINECGETILSNIPDVMGAAVEKLAISMGCQAWARKWAEGFSWTVGPETTDKSQISDNYLSIAKQKWDEGIAIRDDYYKRFGKRNAPSAAINQWNIREYTPPR